MYLVCDKTIISEYFKKDMIHFNEKGYAAWTSIIKPVLEYEYLKKQTGQQG